jgi:hypothetical protein
MTNRRQIPSNSYSRSMKRHCQDLRHFWLFTTLFLKYKLLKMNLLRKFDCLYFPFNTLLLWT